MPAASRRPDLRPTGRSSRARTVLLSVMWSSLALYLIALALHSVGLLPSWDGWVGTLVNGALGMVTTWVPTIVCWLAAYRVRFRRGDVLLAAAAVTAYTLGTTYYLAMTFTGASLPFPSPADIGYVLVYPLLLAALAVTLRRHARGLAAWVWLDCLIGALGAGAVLAVVMDPVLVSADDGLAPLAAVVAIGSPICDLVLCSAVAGITALRGVDMGRRWLMLATGLFLFAASDVAYGLQVTAGTYVLGTPTDAGWAVGLAFMTVWVDSATRGTRAVRRAPRPAGRAAALTVSSAATIAGVAVLAVATQQPVPLLALYLAAGALLAAVARAQLATRMLERMAEQRLRAAATDELTGLPNRRAFYAEAHSHLVEPAASRRALLMLDLDGFKEVNDTLGHRAGDDVLVEVGARLKGALGCSDVLARLGGDEFAVLLTDAGQDAAVEAATRLREALAEPVGVAGTSVRIGVSIGIALFSKDGPDLSVLLRKADIAMYRAKTSQRSHHVYSTADDVDTAALLQTVQELRTAAAEEQFVLHYQPKVDLGTGEVHSVEALVRWQHPTRGLLAPDAFLTLVEESGLMPSLTRTVLAQALDQAAQWHREGHPLAVAVNLCASSLCDPDFPGEVASMLAARGVEPSALQLEITERFLLTDRELAQGILTRLRTSGVRISVDDFGTGYNSLAYLRELPIDELKLDSSFVIPMTHDVRTAALVSSTIELAHTLGMRIVAEGVETANAYDELTRMGCDQAQGYFMSKPIPAADVRAWLGQWVAAGQSPGLSDPAMAVA